MQAAVERSVDTRHPGHFYAREAAGVRDQKGRFARRSRLHRQAVRRPVARHPGAGVAQGVIRVGEGQRVALAAALAIAVFVATAWLALRAIDDLKTASREAIHTRAVIAQLEA